MCSVELDNYVINVVDSDDENITCEAVDKITKNTTRFIIPTCKNCFQFSYWVGLQSELKFEPTGHKYILRRCKAPYRRN